MQRLIRCVFPFVLVFAWVITAGYALSRLASLHDTVAQRWAVSRPPASESEVAGGDRDERVAGGDRDERMAGLDRAPGR